MFWRWAFRARGEYGVWEREWKGDRRSSSAAMQVSVPGSFDGPVLPVLWPRHRDAGDLVSDFSIGRLASWISDLFNQASQQASNYDRLLLYVSLTQAIQNLCATNCDLATHDPGRR